MIDLGFPYLIGFAAILAVRAHDIHADPAEMPGGGWIAIVAVAAMWPLWFAVALVVYAIQAVRS